MSHQLDHYQFNHSNLNKLHQRIDCLSADYSKLLVIRLDLYIRKDYQHEISNQYMTDAIARLRNNMRVNAMFNHLIDYAWKLEYGIDRGWHLHILFFFNGQCVMHDQHLSREIGLYWSQVITHGMGEFNSCNMNQHNYQFNGIGMVDYTDIAKREYLKRAASYLTKVEEVVHPYFDAAGKAIRSFGMSQYKPRESNAGRPRKYLND